MIGHTEQRIGTAYAMPARCQVWVRVKESASPSGPHVAILASLLLSAIRVRVIYRVGTTRGERPADEIALTMPLVPSGERVARPTQVIRGPRGGASMSLQLFDHERRSLTEEREIGACVDGVREASLGFVARVNLVAWLAPRDQGERPDRRLRLDGELVFLDGVYARLEVRPFHRVAEVDGVTVDVPLAHAGTTLRLPERLIERDLPDSPAISVAFEDGDGHTFGRERPVDPVRSA